MSFCTLSYWQSSAKKIFRLVILLNVFVCSLPLSWTWAQEIPNTQATTQSPQTAQLTPPRCQSDYDCQRPGLRGVCQNPGTQTASCVFLEAQNISALAIVPNDCRSCVTGYVTDSLKALFPTIEFEYLNKDDPRAAQLIKEIKIEMLPAYIFTQGLAQDPNFTRLNQMVEATAQGQYYLKPSFSGISYFLNRPLQAGRLDLFFGLTQKEAGHVIGIAKELMEKKKDQINLSLHFVGSKNPETAQFFSPGGSREINENTIAACVEKYYPQKTWDYLSCRLGNIDSPWAQDCLERLSMAVKKIKDCAGGAEGSKLYEDKIRLSDELKISYSPLFLFENTEIFGITPQTTAQEIIRVIESKKKQ